MTESRERYEAGGSALERAFMTYWRMFGDGDDPEREYRFAAHATGGTGRGVRDRLAGAVLRDWRFDFAWPDAMVAVEVEGGTWTRGRHVRGGGFRGDCEKYNAACVLGWRVLRFTAGMLSDDPVCCVETIRRALSA